MRRLDNLFLFLPRISHVWPSTPFFLIFVLAGLAVVALAADRNRPLIDPQLQRPLDIPLERLERPRRTPPVPLQPVNLNTASMEQLVALPGITAALAQQIIGGRPYRDKTDLLRKQILSDDAYNRIEALLTID